jgi:hypothetical protein
MRKGLIASGMFVLLATLVMSSTNALAAGETCGAHTSCPANSGLVDNCRLDDHGGCIGNWACQTMDGRGNPTGKVKSKGQCGFGGKGSNVNATSNGSEATNSNPSMKEEFDPLLEFGF